MEKVKVKKKLFIIIQSHCITFFGDFLYSDCICAIEVFTVYHMQMPRGNNFPTVTRKISWPLANAAGCGIFYWLGYLVSYHILAYYRAVNFYLTYL